MNDLSKVHRTHELQELGLSAVLKAELPRFTTRLLSLGENPGRCFYMLQVQWELCSFQLWGSVACSVECIINVLLSTDLEMQKVTKDIPWKGATLGPRPLPITPPVSSGHHILIWTWSPKMFKALTFVRPAVAWGEDKSAHSGAPTVCQVPSVDERYSHFTDKKTEIWKEKGFAQGHAASKLQSHNSKSSWFLGFFFFFPALLCCVRFSFALWAPNTAPLTWEIISRGEHAASWSPKQDRKKMPPGRGTLNDSPVKY